MKSKPNFTSQFVNLFPEPIAVYSLPSDFHLEYKNILMSIVKDAPDKFRQKFPNEKYTSHICNAPDQNILDNYKDLSGLKKFFHEIVINYISNIGYLCEKIVITDAWLNNASQNSSLGMHYHSNSFISGNYFINFNGDFHTPLTFLNDRIRTPNAPSITLPHNPKFQTIYNTKVLGPRAIEGQVLIWRSHLIHGYELVNKADNRLTLSFNCMPKVCEVSGRYSFEVVDNSK